MWKNARIQPLEVTVTLVVVILGELVKISLIRLSTSLLYSVVASIEG